MLEFVKKRQTPYGRHWISIRTTAFLSFMILFFGTVTYLTYYAKVVYIRNLPIVNTVMPEREERQVNGRFSYCVPEDSIHVDEMNKHFILTARYVSDVMGERYLAARIDIWVLEKRADGAVLVDGIVWEEPIIVGTGETIASGDAVLY